MNSIFTVGQLMFGLYFAWNGLNHFMNLKAMMGYAQSKKVPSPQIAVIGTGLLLLIGGLGVAFNINPKGAAVLLLIFLIPTTFVMHAFWSEHETMAKMIDKVNFGKNLALIGAILMFLG